MEYILNFFASLLSMFLEMAPFIMLGLLLVGVLHAFVKRSFIMKLIGDSNFKSVVKAALLGIPLPLCSCGVVSTAVEIKKSGASNGAVTSFLIATPETSIDSILVTYSLMGPIMAILRPICAFVSGILGGVMVNTFAKNDNMNIDKEPTSSCCCDNDKNKEPLQTSYSCHEEEKSSQISCSCHKEKSCPSDNKPEDTISGCCEENHEVVTKTLTLKDKLKSIFTYSFGTFLDDIAVHFTVGIIIAAFIATFIPADFFINLGINSGIFAMLLMVLIGLPMYICSTASIPIALSLFSKGLSPGATFVFLVAGPVTNIASMIVLSKVMGKKVILIYICSIVFSTVIFGLLIDFLSAHFNFSLYSQITEHTSHSMHGHGTFTWVIGSIFLILLIKSLFNFIIKKAKLA